MTQELENALKETENVSGETAERVLYLLAALQAALRKADWTARERCLRAGRILPARSTGSSTEHPVVRAALKYPVVLEYILQGDEADVMAKGLLEVAGVVGVGALVETLMETNRREAVVIADQIYRHHPNFALAEMMARQYIEPDDERALQGLRWKKRYREQLEERYKRDVETELLERAKREVERFLRYIEERKLVSRLEECNLWGVENARLLTIVAQKALRRGDLQTAAKACDAGLQCMWMEDRKVLEKNLKTSNELRGIAGKVVGRAWGDLQARESLIEIMHTNGENEDSGPLEQEAAALEFAGEWQVGGAKWLVEESNDADYRVYRVSRLLGVRVPGHPIRRVVEEAVREAPPTENKRGFVSVLAGWIDLGRISALKKWSAAVLKTQPGYEEWAAGKRLGMYRGSIRCGGDGNWFEIGPGKG